jgi:hypothetical protein
MVSKLLHLCKQIHSFNSIYELEQAIKSSL